MEDTRTGKEIAQDDAGDRWDGATILARMGYIDDAGDRRLLFEFYGYLSRRIANNCSDKGASCSARDLILRWVASHRSEFIELEVDRAAPE